jgi:hypothetical protein
MITFFASTLRRGRPLLSGNGIWIVAISLLRSRIALPSLESAGRAAESARRPIGPRSVHLASKTVHFEGYFQPLSRVRLIESSRLLERAMGIEFISQFLSPNETRRYHRSKSQLVPFGAKSIQDVNVAKRSVHHGRNLRND